MRGRDLPRNCSSSCSVQSRQSVSVARGRRPCCVHTSEPSHPCRPKARCVHTSEHITSAPRGKQDLAGYWCAVSAVRCLLLSPAFLSWRGSAPPDLPAGGRRGPRTRDRGRRQVPAEARCVHTSEHITSASRGKQDLAGYWCAASAVRCPLLSPAFLSSRGSAPPDLPAGGRPDGPRTPTCPRWD